MKTNTLIDRNRTLETQLHETREELNELMSRPLEYAYQIRVSRDHIVSYINTMLAKERRILRELNDTSNERDRSTQLVDKTIALAAATMALRGISCQPGELCENTRLNASIYAKAAEIALR